MRFLLLTIVALPFSQATLEIPATDNFPCFNDIDLDCLRQPDALAFNESGCLARFYENENTLLFPFNDCFTCILEFVVVSGAVDDNSPDPDPCFPPPSSPTVGCDSEDFAQLDNSLANNDTVGEFMTTVSNQCYACLVPALNDALEKDDDPFFMVMLVINKFNFFFLEIFQLMIGDDNFQEVDDEIVDDQPSYNPDALEEFMNSPLSFAVEFFESQNVTEYCFAGFPLTSSPTASPTSSPTASPTSAAGVLQAGASVVASIVWLVALAM